MLRYSLASALKTMFPFFRMQLNTMWRASGNSLLCGHVRPLSSDSSTFPSAKPNALLSRCESTNSPAGCGRYQKWSVAASPDGGASESAPRPPRPAATSRRPLPRSRPRTGGESLVVVVSSCQPFRVEPNRGHSSIQTCLIAFSVSGFMPFSAASIIGDELRNQYPGYRPDTFRFRGRNRTVRPAHPLADIGFITICSFLWRAGEN